MLGVSVRAVLHAVGLGAGAVSGVVVWGGFFLPRRADRAAEHVVYLVEDVVVAGGVVGAVQKFVAVAVDAVWYVVEGKAELALEGDAQLGREEAIGWLGWDGIEVVVAVRLSDGDYARFFAWVPVPVSNKYW